MKKLTKADFVAFKNSDGTIDLFERSFHGEPCGYGQTGYHRVEFDVIVEPKPMGSRVAMAVVALLAAIAPFAGMVLLATWMPMGMA